MYFPFLRGKKYEMQTVKAISSVIRNNNNVIPIIEPVNTNSTTIKILTELDNDKIPFLLVINPYEGDLKDDFLIIEKKLISILKNYETSRLLFVVSTKTEINDVEKMLKKYHQFRISFLHMTNTSIASELSKLSKQNPNIEYHIFLSDRTSKTYHDIFKDSMRVIIEDGFKSAERNSDYIEEEVFSDLLLRYRDNYDGFGDYLIVGKQNPSGGGPAFAVALHYTHYSETERAIMIKHFISDDIIGTENVQGKYFQALKKLIDFIDEFRFEPFTIGEKMYHENDMVRKYHNLGYPKKASMCHHIELISELI